MEKKWWEKEPMIISAVQCNYGEDSYEILREHTVKHGFNTEQLFHLTAEGAQSYYNEKRDGAKLDAYLKESRKEGIREIAYINIHCMLPETYQEHPDWSQILVDGKPMMAYNIYNYICINSSWHQYILEQIKGICSHDIDGIFLDGPCMMLDGCYCPACQDKFLKKYGHSIYECTLQEHVEFNVDAVTELMQDIHAIVKAMNPNILLYINNSALRADVTGSNTRKVFPYVDVLGAEGGFVWVSKNTPLWHVSPMAKAIETQAQGKPTVIFIAGDYKPWSFCMHTAQETKLYYAQSLANGANVWYGIHGPIAQMDTPGGQVAVEMNEFIQKNTDVFHGSKSVANVALMWSQNSANFYSSSVSKTDFTKAEVVGDTKGVKGDHYKSFMGFYEILMRGHIQHDVIDEESVLTGELSKYDLLILPTCACMSDETAEKIKEFVKNGGNVISSFDTGFYNAKGFSAEAPKLADVQGIASVNDIIEYPIGIGSGYQRLEEPSKVTEGLSWKYVPATTKAVMANTAAGALVAATYCAPMASRYMAIPEASYPALIENQYGKGSSVYFAGAFGEFYHEMTHPDHKKMVLNAVKNMAKPIVESDAPGSVEMVLREKEGRYYLHLINMTGEMERPLQRIIPLCNIKVTLSGLKLDHVSTLNSLTGTAPVDESFVNGTLTFTIPVVNDYEIISIE
jgi:hypothetical protein